MSSNEKLLEKFKEIFSSDSCLAYSKYKKIVKFETKIDCENLDNQIFKKVKKIQLINL